MEEDIKYKIKSYNDCTYKEKELYKKIFNISDPANSFIVRIPNLKIPTGKNILEYFEDLILKLSIE